MPEENNTLHQNTPSINACHLLCTSCKTTLHLNSEIFEGAGFLLKCPNCQYPVSIRNVFAQDGLKISELFGCKYIGKDLTFSLQQQVRDWITDTISFHESSGTESAEDNHVEQLDLAGDSLVDKTVTTWDVEKKNGVKLTFEAFNDLRKAVEEGKIIKGDIIVTSGGVRHPVETYPGTADVFGNARNLTGTDLSAIHKKKKKSLAKALPSIPAIVGAVILAGAIVFPIAWPRYQNMQGANALEAALAVATPATQTNIPQLIDETKSILVRRQVSKFSDLSQQLTSAFKHSQDQTELISYIALLWSEIARSTRDPRLQKKAGYLIKYAKSLQPMSGTPLLAEGVHSFYVDSKENAKKLFQKAAEKDASAALIAATFLESNLEQETASALLYSAYEHAPENKLVLLTLLDSMEKQNKLKEAIGYAQKLTRFFPEEDVHKNKLKSLLRKFGDYEALEEMLRQELLTSTNPAPSHVELIRIFSQQKRYDRVLNEARDFIEKYPDSEFLNEVRFMFAQAENSMSSQAGGSSGSGMSSQPDDTQQSRSRSRRRRRG